MGAECVHLSEITYVYLKALFQSTFQFYSVVEKKKSLTEQNFDGHANEPGVVNSHNHANES